MPEQGLDLVAGSADGRAALNAEEALAVQSAMERSTADPGFGVTDGGFVPKPFARLLAEKLALARQLFGDDLDLGSGSALRKLLEIAALEDARVWSALAATYDDSFIATATGDALSRLGDEVGLTRPFVEARGRVTITLQGSLPAGSSLRIPRGARMLTDGGHHAATDKLVVLSAEAPQGDVEVVAFYPGAEHNLDPGTPSQKLVRWHRDDAALQDLVAAQEAAPDDAPVDVAIEHTEPLSGGELQWPDARYRELLLRAPRSVWTADAIRIAASLVPGVRQVQVRDAWGGLDIHQSIFGTAETDFVERLFSEDEEAASPYRVVVVVAPTPAAIWDGPDGLRATVRAAIEDLRPLSIYPRIQQGDQVGVGIQADLVLSGVALPTGSRDSVNDSPLAKAFKNRLFERVRRYVEDLGFGEPVRFPEVIAALMEEPGVVDIRGLRLLKHPPGFDAAVGTQPIELAPGANVELDVNQVPVFVDAPERLRV